MARKRTIYKERNRLNAALLAFFGGALGLHKFYLRDTGAGIFFIMIGLVTRSIIGFPVSAILGIFDAMKLLMMPTAEFDRKYNRHLLKQNRTYRNNPRSKVIERPTKRVKNNPFKKSALKKYADFALEEAMEDFVKALEVDPGDHDIHFNLACVYSLLEEKEKAFAHISKSVELGFVPLEKIKTHDDLAFLRIQPEFESFERNKYKSYDVKQSEKKKVPQVLKEKSLDDDILLSQLNKLKELREKGVLSEQDYITETKKLGRSS